MDKNLYCLRKWSKRYSQRRKEKADDCMSGSDHASEYKIICALSIFRFVFGDLSWGVLSLQRRDEPDELAAVFDVGRVALVPIDGGGVGGVEDGGDVRLDGDPTLVAGLVGVG